MSNNVYDVSYALLVEAMFEVFHTSTEVAETFLSLISSQFSGISDDSTGVSCEQIELVMNTHT